MVSLVELSADLGPQLVTVGARKPSSRQLSGVHVSELEDPTPYLEGGELLLTTGMPLGRTSPATIAYVGRLQTRGVHALGVGLGPWLEQVPDYLVEACAEAGIDLLAVPDGVPFQSVSRAFWGLSARSEQTELMASLGTQTSLARAAMRPGATPAVVRGLAQVVEGWAAYLPATSGSETYWPPRTEVMLPLLRAETLRLNRLGVHSAATFELHGQAVVEYPIATGGRMHGFLAVGPGRTLTAADRHVIITVSTLLAMKAHQREVAAASTATIGAAVAKLLLRGHAEAARILAEDMGLQELPSQVRLLGLRTQPEDDIAQLCRAVPSLRRDTNLPALTSIAGSCLLRHQEDNVLYLVLAEDDIRAEPGTAPVQTEEEQTTLAGVLSGPVDLSQVAATVATVRQILRRAPAGSLMGMDHSLDAQAREWVRILAAYSRVDLVGSVTQYLRHRGHWENASRELKVHRNSLRHRISTAQSLLGVDLDDPDVFAPLWLALRDQMD